MKRVAMGTSGLLTPDGLLDRPAGYGSWRAPRPTQISVRDGQLVWDAPPRPGLGFLPRTVRSGAGMLEAFALLSEAGDEAILKYARKWGVLGLCAQHGKPMSHVPTRLWWKGELDEHPVCKPAGPLRGPSRESIQRWRAYAAQAQAALDIAAELSRPGRPRTVDGGRWEPLEELYPPGVMKPILRASDVPSQRRLLAAAVQEWLELGDAQMSFQWTGDRPQYDLGTGSLFGALALQLSLTVARLDALVICDACGRSYIPRRQNRPGVPRRCPDPECRDRLPKRLYAQRRRAQERQDRDDPEVEHGGLR